MLEIQQRVPGPGESAAGAMYLSLRIFNLSVCLIYFCLIFVEFVGMIIYKVYNI